MTAETHRFPKGLLHNAEACDVRWAEMLAEAEARNVSPPTLREGHSAKESCAEVDRQKAWATLASTMRLNAEMFVSSGHTDAEWVMTFDREREDDPTTPGMEAEGGMPVTADRFARPDGKEPVPETRGV